MLFLLLWLKNYDARQAVLENEPRHLNPAYLVEAENGAVASENKRCSDIGIKVLRAGGNAVDAAVAATFCIGVVNLFS